MAPRRPPPPDPPRVAAVEPGGLAHRLSLAPGDQLLAINRHRLRDEIDLLFWSADGIETLSWRTPAGRTVRRRLDPSPEEPLRLTLDPPRPRVCGNDCVFCFVHQNPRGLRRTLYLKDEDYRLSFLHGNYITGTSLSPADLRRIVAMHLSPLHFSVHTTDPALRGRMLGRRGLPDIMRLLRRLARGGIELHTQIVVCPGWNDGAEIERTVRDLLTLRPSLRSIALVPVGLTAHRVGLPTIPAIDGDFARAFIAFAEPLQREAEAAAGEPVLFLTDEWSLRAGQPAPDYTDLPFPHQIENGVGLIWFFLRDSKRPRRALPRPWRVAALTAPLAARGLAAFWQELNDVESLTVEPIALENSLLGPPVTVTGLLPGRDFQRAIRARAGDFDQFLLPGNALRESDHLFLDDLPLRNLVDEGASLGVNVDAVLGDAPATWAAIERRARGQQP